jgi:hypothetical protein
MATASIQERTRKKGKCYQITIESDPNPITKKRNRTTETVYGTRKEAEHVSRELLHQIDNNAFIKNDDTTLQQFIEEWLKVYIIPHKAKTTTHFYQVQLKRYVYPTIGNIKLQQLKTIDIQKLYNQLQIKSTVSDKPLSGKTIKNLHMNIRSALSMAVEHEIISRNPAVCDNSSIQITLENGEKFIFFIHNDGSIDLQRSYEEKHLKTIFNEDFDYGELFYYSYDYIKSKMREFEAKEIIIYKEIDRMAKIKDQENFVSRIKLNPENYFWYNKFENFKPDKAIKGNKTQQTVFRKIGMEKELGISNVPRFYKIPTNIQDTHIYFVNECYQQKLIEYMEKELNIKIDEEAMTLQITFNDGDKHIFALGSSFPFEEEQAIFDYNYYKANRSDYIDYEDFVNRYSNIVYQQLTKIFDKITEDI